jgi:outer membrane lipoprotein SlyB
MVGNMIFIGNIFIGNVLGNVVGDVKGNVTGNLIGDSYGKHTGPVCGDVTGNLTGDSTGKHTGPVCGDVDGNVTGNLIGDSYGKHTGPVCGPVTGDVTGNLTGDSTGKHTGPVCGPVTGDVTGNLTGDSTGKHTGPVCGDVDGNVTGNLIGDSYGKHTGPVCGDVTGNLTGDSTGKHTGPVCGDVDGNVTGNLIGDSYGKHTGPVCGNVRGNLIGDSYGKHTGPVCGDLTGNVNSETVVANLVCAPEIQVDIINEKTLHHGVIVDRVLHKDNMVVADKLTANTKVVTDLIDPESGTLDVDGNLLPVLDDKYNLGSMTKKWKTMYTNDLIVCQNATVMGNLTTLGNITIVGTETFVVDDPCIVINNEPNTVLNAGYFMQRYQTENDTLDGAVVDGPTNQTANVVAAASENVTLASMASGDDDRYNDWWISISNGTGVNQVRKIVDYDGNSKVATIQSAWTVVPDTSSIYGLHPCNFVGLIWDEGMDKFTLSCKANGNCETSVTEMYMSLCAADIESHNVVPRIDQTYDLGTTDLKWATIHVADVDMCGNIVGGNLIGDSYGKHTGPVCGDVTGNLEGKVTGNVCGNLIGDSYGKHTGPVCGDVTGNLEGKVTGNVCGNLIGDSYGKHTGPVCGDVTGNLEGKVTGNVCGNLIGDSYGKHYGNVCGNLIGDVYGNVYGNVITVVKTVQTLALSYYTSDQTVSSPKFIGLGNNSGMMEDTSTIVPFNGTISCLAFSVKTKDPMAADGSTARVWIRPPGGNATPTTLIATIDGNNGPCTIATGNVSIPVCSEIAVLINPTTGIQPAVTLCIDEVVPGP